MRTVPTTAKAYGIALAVAPILLLASTIASALGNGLGDDEVGGVIQIYGAAAFLIAFIGIVRIAEGSGVGPRALTALLVLGSMSITAFGCYGLNAIYTDLGTFDLNEQESATALLALQLPGILFPVTFATVGILLARSGAISLPHGAVLILAAVLFPVSRITGSMPVAIVCDLLFLVALVPIGWIFLRRGALTESSSTQSSPA